MPERDGYPEGVPCWVDTGRVDPEGATAFYGGLFGWTFEDRAAAGAPGRYLVAQLDGRDVAGVGELPEASGPAGWNTYVWVESADRAADAALTAGGRVLMDPMDVGPAGRMAMLADPTGAAFGVWQAGEHRGARVVNETGAWVATDFATRDLATATAFYGEVFGWEVDELVDEGYANVRLPGYGEHLVELDPELPARLAEYGASEGFADVVGWMSPMTSAQYPDHVPSHWGITFAVDDTDASAARAAELGGTVLVPPFDTQWVRMAVIADPDGAVFTVATFIPPV